MDGGDASIKLANVSEYIYLPTVACAERALRKRLLPSEPVVRKLPAASAWSTVETLVRQAQERAQARETQRSEKRRKPASLWDSPGSRGLQAALQGSRDELEQRSRRKCLAASRAESRVGQIPVQLNGVTEMNVLQMIYNRRLIGDGSLRPHDVFARDSSNTACRQGHGSSASSRKHRRRRLAIRPDQTYST